MYLYQRSSEPSWYKPSVKECVMHSFTIRQKHNPQEAILHFGYLHPTSNSAIGLDNFSNRRSDGLLDPLLTNDNPIRPATYRLKVTCDFHFANVADFRLVGLLPG